VSLHAFCSRGPVVRTPIVTPWRVCTAYAPARHEHKQAFWEKLNAYVQSLAPQYSTSTDKDLILAGDWSSYMDTERDIYRLDLESDTTLLTTGSANQHLRTFLQDLQEVDLPLFDPMARDKLTAFNDFTFLSSNQKYRSISNLSHLSQLTIANPLVF
jgi:hypothetical protein